ncbi:MAG: hypothetical protein K2X52_08525 [Mycobacteriaceae bacterium]|nr:hypothetical protein [Mycobacteriaceae bacterium]
MTPTQTIWFAAEACPPASDPWWTLTQPRATVLAACIALIAASIAYLGVLKTTSTTRRENRRTEKVGLLSDGLIACQNYSRAILQIGHTTDLELRADLISRLNAGRIDEFNDAISLALAKLSLYGFTDITKLVAALAAQLVTTWQAVVNAPKIDVPTQVIADSHNACVKAFQKAFAGLE